MIAMEHLLAVLVVLKAKAFNAAFVEFPPLIVHVPAALLVELTNPAITA